ncbi:MAG: T9SS type A sorting domain-containing protein [Bacteroidetes bacterium]|nr:T9SS type A sorting domain-containing protein [Bacteroidota bacterium]
MIKKVLFAACLASVFSINAQVTVTFPNGGETLPSGIPAFITWDDSQTSAPTSDIYLSLNGGANWTLVSAGESNLGIGFSLYSWSVPSTTSTSALIKVDDGVGADQSDAVFTIGGGLPNSVQSINGVASVKAFFANNELNISNIEKASFNNLKVYDVTGNLVFKSDAYSNAYSVNDFKSGIYLIQIADKNNNIVTKKIVK